MERKIKFRGRNIHTGEWLYGDYHREGKTHYITKPGDFMHEYAPIEFIVDEKTLGQFTGMLDKNGKEIYEGDIIRIDSHVWLDCKELDSVNAEVIFEEYMFDARWRNPDAGQPIPFHPDDDPDYEPEYICEMLANLPNTIEIIGSIHDNPELIRDKR